jgi:hypothetical protein
MRISRLLPFLLAALPLVACGGGGSDQPDAGGGNIDSGPPDADLGSCPDVSNPVQTISAFPGTATGTIGGAGADISVDQGVCANEVGYYSPVGQDAAVKLTGLVAGDAYKVTLTAADDLSVYVITSCDGTTMMPGAGGCLAFSDLGLSGDDEVIGFVAPASGDAWLVVDTFSDTQTGFTGDFSVTVDPADCVTDAQCSDPTPSCSDFECVECADDFACDSATPVCDPAAHTCGAGASSCTADDARDTGTSDDGPANAFTLVLPSAGTPTVATAAICNVPATEADWYVFTLTGDTDLGFDLTGTIGVDVNFEVYDGTHALIGTLNAIGDEHVRATLPADTYYIKVTQATPAATMAATAYTLTLLTPDCDTNFDCTVDGASVCIASGTCGAGPSACLADDANDTGTDDDGPAGANALTSGVPAIGSICSAPDPYLTESDFYSINVTTGQGLSISLDWTGTSDLDVYAYDSTGRQYGFTYWAHPEVVTLSDLPAGLVYVQVVLYSPNGATTTSTAYTLTATTTAATTCASADDCDNVFSTQIYRGDCDAGACHFIAPTTPIASGACDSADDCTSGMCSYLLFEDDAHLSVCTTACTASADCVGAQTGFTCTTPFNTNFCVPACTGNLDCGVNAGSATVETAPPAPWDYLTCTSGVCNL